MKGGFLQGERLGLNILRIEENRWLGIHPQVYLAEGAKFLMRATQTLTHGTIQKAGHEPKEPLDALRLRHKVHTAESATGWPA